ncbi:sodium-dependent phosphate transport protein 2A-like [Diadema antillarum]|uniref:sodium-dependent phosphate transport protein 2A-like n=1 Tax=Diadema antillarum TaxID=105358 RepID=UPI003A83BE1F
MDLTANGSRGGRHQTSSVFIVSDEIRRHIDDGVVNPAFDEGDCDVDSFRWSKGAQKTRKIDGEDHPDYKAEIDDGDFEAQGQNRENEYRGVSHEGGGKPAALDPVEVTSRAKRNPRVKFRAASFQEKNRIIIGVVVRWCLLLAFLYLFVCSLDILSLGFSLIGGAAAGAVIANNDLLINPLCGLMIGVLVTVLVQSSSTSTSVVVAMVSARVLTVGHAIPIIMGTNIGTAITNTLVAFGQVKEQDEFRRAFSCAAVHDLFNCMTVVVLLPVEMATSYLEVMTKAVVESFNFHETNTTVEFLKVITSPLTRCIVQVNNDAIFYIAEGYDSRNIDILLRCTNETGATCEYNHLFAWTSLSDVEVGFIVLAMAIFGTSVCLLVTVKLLNSFLRGGIARVVEKFINADFPGYLAFLTGYVAMLIGAVCTIVVQSSSIFTSVLTPLAGLGLLSLERMYPLTLGSNIGTTLTGIIAALASNGGELEDTLQIALCHFFFNITGILIWYPVPFLRVIPVKLAEMLGNKTAKYRWFAILYVAVVFLLLPGAVFGLNVAGYQYLMGVGIPILAVSAVVVVVSILQRKFPRVLPEFLKTWDFLPAWMHSLKPMDRLLACRCCRGGETTASTCDVSVEHGQATLPSILSSAASAAELKNELI